METTTQERGITLEKVLASIYIIDYARKLVRTGNIGVMIYLGMNIVMYVALFGGFQTPQMIPIALFLYVICVTIALSPIGEFILRLQAGAKKPKRFAKKMPGIEERLVPIFTRVHQRARAADPSVSSKVKLFIIKEDCVNAYATGRKTVCVTTGILSYTDDQIEAVLAHEFGHIAHRDTDTLLVIAVGNFLITILFFIFRMVIELILVAVGDHTTFLTAWLNWLMRMLVNLFLVLLMRLWMKIGLLFANHSSRQNEFEADRFACELGYQAQFYDAIYRLDGGSGKSGFLASISSTHPDTVDRLERVQAFDPNTIVPPVQYVMAQQAQGLAVQAPADTGLQFSDIANKQNLGTVMNYVKQAPQGFSGMADKVKEKAQQMQQGAAQQAYVQQGDPMAQQAYAQQPAVPAAQPAVPAEQTVAAAAQPAAPIAAAMPNFQFAKPFRKDEKLFAQYGDTPYYYHAQLLGIQSGQADIVFFDGVRQWVPTAQLMHLEDLAKQQGVEANWNKQGTFYPCAFQGFVGEQEVQVMYGDERMDTLTLNEIRFTK